MHIRFLSLFFATLSLTPIQALGWGWKDAATLAARGNPLLRSQGEQVEATARLVSVARAGMFPKVSLRGGWNEFVDQQKQLEHQAFIGPRFDWLIYSGGKIRRGVDIAGYQDRQAELTRALTSIQVHARLRQAFANALYAKNSLALARKIEKQRHENVRFTQIRYQSGLEFKWVYSSSTVKWESAKVKTQEALLDQQSALKELEAVSGPLPIRSIEEISDADFYPAANGTLPADAFARMDAHPQIEFQRSRVDESRARVDFVNADRFPALGVQANAFASSVEEVSLFPYLSAGAFFSMPLFEANRLRNNTAIAKTGYAQRKNELDQARLDLAARIQRTYQDYALAEQRVGVSRMNLQANEDRAKVVSEQYRSGSANFLDWERSQDDWVGAETDLLNTVRAWQTTRAKYEEALGVELNTL